MSTEIVQAFAFEGHEVRTAHMEDGTPAVVLADIARLLGYRDATAASRLLRDHHKGYTKVCTPGGTQEMLVVTERGFNRLIIKSNAANADDIQDWLTDDVMPAISKTGGYGRPQIDLSRPEGVLAMAEQFTNTARQLVEAHKEIEHLAPRAAFADAVSASHSSILVGELAKILRGNGVNIGQNRLFERLRNEGYLIKREGTDYNMPTQRSMDLGLFKIKETTVRHSDGHVTINKTPKVTGKGQTYFVDRYLGRDLVESEAR